MWPLLRRELEAAGVGVGGWALIGSGAMRVAGLDVEPGDLDLFVRPWIYERLLTCGWVETYPRVGDPPMLVLRGDRHGELEVNAWFRWRHETRWKRAAEPTLENVIGGARRVDDFWWIMDLRLLALWKREILAELTKHEPESPRIEKDARHLALLDAAGYIPLDVVPSLRRR
jgi:hypothetical protein